MRIGQREREQNRKEKLRKEGSLEERITELEEIIDKLEHEISSVKAVTWCR